MADSAVSGMHLLKTLELLFSFFQHFLGHLGFFDPLAKLSHFFRAFVQFTQFFLNRFELLAQEVFALGLVHLPLGLGLNFLLHGEDFDLLCRESR